MANEDFLIQFTVDGRQAVTAMEQIGQQAAALEARLNSLGSRTVGGAGGGAVAGLTPGALQQTNTQVTALESKLRGLQGVASSGLVTTPEAAQQNLRDISSVNAELTKLKGTQSTLAASARSGGTANLGINPGAITEAQRNVTQLETSLAGLRSGRAVSTQLGLPVSGSQFAQEARAAQNLANALGPLDPRYKSLTAQSTALANRSNFLTQQLNQSSRAFGTHASRIAEGIIVYQGYALAAQGLADSVKLVIDVQREQIRLSQALGGGAVGAEQAKGVFESLGKIAIDTVTPFEGLVAAADNVGFAFQNIVDPAARAAAVEKLMTSAGQLTTVTQRDVGEESQKLIAIMRQLGLNVDDIPDILDKVTIAGGRTQVGMTTLIDGLENSAAAARTAKVPLDTLIALIPKFAIAAGISGGEAGTKLKTLFSTILRDPTAEKGLQAITGGLVSIYDASHNLRSVQDVFADLFALEKEGVLDTKKLDQLFTKMAPPLNPGAKADLAIFYQTLKTLGPAVQDVFQAPPDALEQLVNHLNEALGQRFLKLVEQAKVGLKDLFGPSILQGGELVIGIIQGLGAVLSIIPPDVLRLVVNFLSLFAAMRLIIFAGKEISALLGVGGLVQFLRNAATSAALTKSGALEASEGLSVLGATATTTTATISAEGTVASTAAASNAALGESAAGAAAGIETEGAVAGATAAEVGALGVAGEGAAVGVAAAGTAAAVTATEVEAVGVASATTGGLMGAVGAAGGVMAGGLRFAQVAAAGLLRTLGPLLIAMAAFDVANFVGDVGEASGNLNKKVGSAIVGQNVTQLEATRAKLAEQIKGATTKFTINPLESLAQNIATIGLVGNLKEIDDQIAKLKEKGAGATVSMDDLSGAFKSTADASDGTTGSIEQQTNAYEASINAALARAGASAAVTDAELTEAAAVKININLADERTAALKKIDVALQKGKISIAEHTSAISTLSRVSEDAAKLTAIFGDKLKVIPELEGAAGKGADVMAGALFKLILTGGKNVDQILIQAEALIKLAGTEASAAAIIAANPIIIRTITITQSIEAPTTGGFFSGGGAGGALPGGEVVHQITSGGGTASATVAAALRELLAGLKSLGGTITKGQSTGGGTFGTGGGGGGGTTAAARPQTPILDIGDLSASQVSKLVAIATALRNRIPGETAADKGDVVALIKDAKFLTSVKGIDDRLLRIALQELTDTEKARLDLEKQNLQRATLSNLVTNVGSLGALISQPTTFGIGGNLSLGQGLNFDPTKGNFVINVPITLKGLEPAKLQQLIYATIAKAIQDALKVG